MGIIINMDDRRPKESSITDTDLVALGIATSKTQESVERIRSSMGAVVGYDFVAHTATLILRGRKIFSKKMIQGEEKIPYMYRFHISLLNNEDFESIRTHVDNLMQKLPQWDPGRIQLFTLRNTILRHDSTI